ncbi:MULTISPECIES: hypothetical protein [unclassified Microbacterium]|uniref:hypothetical protein n=1 Tax=unclassified Microbacterium TaxID=2609290 RepID=UPI00301A879E
MPLTLDIAANTRSAVSGVKDVGQALESVADSLDDLARDAARSGDRAERAFSDMTREAKKADRATDDTRQAVGKVSDSLGDLARDADRSGDRVERSFADMVREAKKADKAIDGIGDGAKKGFGKASDAGAEFKDETLSNLSEVTSSFNGSMESVGDLVQGTLGGLTQGLGPGLGIAAAAAAAGVGVITDAFVKAGEAADEARDSAFQFAYDVGGALDAAGYTQRIAEWTGDTEKLKQAQDIAKVSGQNVADVINALASGGAKLDALWDAFEKGANTTDVATNRALELEGALKGTREGYLNGGDAARIAASLNYEYATSVGVATGETDDLGNAIYKLPDGKDIVVNAKTKTAYEDLDALERRQISDKTAWVRLQVDDREVRYYEPPAKRGTVYFSGGNVAQLL